MGAVRLVGAGCGMFPILLSAYFNYLSISGACSLATTTAMLHSALPYNNSTNAQLVAAADGSSGVVLVLTCLMCLGVHRTIAGVLRILWIVVMVTSSCTYVYMKTSFPHELSFIPNDLTIVALGTALLGLAASTVYTRVFYRPVVGRDARVTGAEILFALGALTLRFDDEIQDYVPAAHIGSSIWYASEWSACLWTVYVLKTTRTSPRIVGQ